MGAKDDVDIHHLDVVEPGDMILVKSGDYAGWEVTLSRKGTPQKPIVVTAEAKAKEEEDKAKKKLEDKLKKLF